MKLLDNLTTYAKQQDSIAYIHNDECLTYEQLWIQSVRLADYLQETLQDDKTLIPVFGHKSSMMLICFHRGAVKAINEVSTFIKEHVAIKPTENTSVIQNYNAAYQRYVILRDKAIKTGNKSDIK